MTLSTARRVTLAAPLLALAPLAVCASPAQATPPARLLSDQVVLDHAGATTTFGTWLWTDTRVCARNEHSGPIHYNFRAGFSNPEYFSLEPGHARCDTRTFGGFTVTVVSSTDGRLVVWTE